MNFELMHNEITDQLGTVLKGRATPFAPDSISPPAGYMFGDETNYTQSYANGLTRLKTSVTVAVERQPLRVAWKAIAGFTSDTGETSVKQCLESGVYTAFHTLVVVRSVVGDVQIGEVTYKGVQFDLEITGSGS